MANGNADIYLLFGVQGGGTLAGESGKQIQKDLLKIAEQINQNPIEIKFKASEQSKNDLRKELEAVISAVGIKAVSEAARVSKTVSSSGGGSGGSSAGTSGVDATVEQYRRARKEIETILHGLEQSINSAKMFDNGAAAEKFIQGAEAIKKKLTDLDGELISAGQSSAEFETEIARLGWRAKATTDNISELIGQTKNANKFGDIYSNTESTINSMLKRIESERQAIEKMLTRTSGTSAEKDVSADISNLKRQYEELGKLEKSVIEGDSSLTKSVFADKLSEISLNAQQAKGSINQYLLEQRKIVSEGKQEVDQQTALMKIENERARVKASLRKAESMNLDESAKDQVEWLKMSVDELNNLESKIRSSSDVVSKNEFTKSFNDIHGAVQQATHGLDEFISKEKQAVDQTQALKRIESERQAIESQIAQASKYGISEKEGYKVEELKIQLEKLDALKEQVFAKDVTKNEFNEELGIITAATKTAENALKEYVNQVQDANAKMDITAKVNSVQYNISGILDKSSGYENNAEIELRRSKIEGISKAYGDLEKSLKAGIITTEQFDNESKKLSTGLQIQKNALEQLIAAEKEQERQANLIKVGSKEYADANDQITKSLEQVIAAKNKYEKSGSATKDGHISSLKRYEDELSKLDKELKKGTLSQDEYNSAIKELQLNIGFTTTSLEQYRSPLEALASSVSQTTKEIIGFYGTRQIVMKGISVVKDMVNQAVELETAFADTRIVTHASAEELENYANTVMNTATKIGTSVNDLVSATTTYARLGYNLDEASILAEYTGMLERVGNIDTQKAEDAVTAILKAFPDEADVNSVERIMDMLVQTGNNAPISVSQIAEGMTNASSALAAANNDFKQSVALLTAANTTVQNASKSSTALRTISARIRKTKSELDDLGETMEESTYENLVAGLTKHNVMLTDINGEYRSTYDIMKDISEHWSEMTNMEQSALAEAIAGNRQQTVFYSLIENFGEAEKAMEGMVGSAGSLSESYSVYLDTTAAHVQQFKTQWQALSKDVVNSNVAKGFVDIGTGALKFADALAKLNLLLPTILGTMTAIKALSYFKTINASQTATMGLVTSVTKENLALKSLEIEFAKLNAVEQKAVVTNLQLAASNGNSGAKAALAALGYNGLAVSEMAAKEATDALNWSVKGLFASNPIGWVLLFGSAIVSIVSTVIHWKEKNEETARSITEINDAIKQTTDNTNRIASDFRSLKATADDLIPRFTTLCKGVNDFGENVSLTEEEYAEFVELNNKIAELFPSLNAGYDSNGNAILNLSYKADDLTESLWNAVEAQRALANEELAAGMDEAVQNAIELEGAYKQQESDYEQALLRLVSLKEELQNGAILSPDELKGYTDEIVRAVPEFKSVVDEMTSTWVAEMSKPSSAQFGNVKVGVDQDAFKKYESDIDSYIGYVKRSLHDVRKDLEDNSAWNAVGQTAMAWIQSQTDFTDAPDVMQTLMNKMIGSIDYGEIGAKTQADVKNYIYDNVITPITDMSDDAQFALAHFMDAQDMFKSGKTSVKEYNASLNGLTQALKDAGVSGETTTAILKALGASDLSNKIKAISGEIKGEITDINAFVDGLSASDVEIAYNILAQNGSMTLDELESKMLEAKEVAAETGAEISKAFDAVELFDNLKDAASSIDSITSAMEKLNKGTALTTSELIKLAKQYPELLKQSNLFTDGSIAGQKEMLKVVLDVAQKEYEAEVDTNIAKLNNELEAVKAQILLEQDKQKTRLAIKTKADVGMIKEDTEYVEEIAHLNELESGNFASMEGDKVVVNQDAMNKLNSDTNSALRDMLEQGWNKFAEGIDTAMGISLDSAVQKTTKALYVMSDEMREFFEDYTQTLKIYYEVADPNARSAIENYFDQFGYTIENLDFGYLFDESYRNIFSTKAQNGFSGSVSELIKGYDGIESWYADQTQKSEEIVSNLTAAAATIQTEINNLEGLKESLRSNLAQTLDGIISDSSSSSGSDSSSDGSSSTASKLSQNNEFKSWYDEAKHKVVMGEMEQAEFIAELKEHLDKAVRDGIITEEESWKYLEEIKKALEDFTSDAEKAIDNLVQYRIKMLKSEAEKEKDALNKRLSALKDFYDKQKQLLRDQQSEENYQDEQSKKRSTIAQLENEISQLKTDYSAEAQKRRAELRLQLKEAQEELNAFEKEHAYDVAEQALDDEYERQAAEIQSVIDTIDASLNDPQALYNIALNDIKNNSESIYDAMMKYGQETGNGKSNEANDLWTKASDALDALKQYWSQVDPNTATTISIDGITSLEPYASGTKYATKGLHMFDEYGPETVFVSGNGNRYRMFSAGEKVLDADASNFLYQFAQSRGNVLSEITGHSAVGVTQITSAGGMTSINMGDIIINGNADERTVSEIRRAQREMVDTVLREFSKLKR